jgi:murein DD-endopeptidase / murein LD-carboxypeptidase
MDAALPSWVSDYVGVPYATRGRDRHGCDCWGLVALVLRERFGADLPEYLGADWYRGQDPQRVGRDALAFAARFSPVEPGAERTGDGVLIRMRAAPLHVGIVIVPGVMLHCHEEADACVESYRSLTWERRIVGFYRYEAPQ